MNTLYTYFATATAQAINYSDDNGNDKTFYQLSTATKLPVNFLGETTTSLQHSTFGLKGINKEPEASIYLDEKQFNAMKGTTYYCILTILQSGEPQITQVSEKLSDIPSQLQKHTSYHNPTK